MASVSLETVMSPSMTWSTNSPIRSVARVRSARRRGPARPCEMIWSSREDLRGEFSAATGRRPVESRFAYVHLSGSYSLPRWLEQRLHGRVPCPASSACRCCCITSWSSSSSLSLPSILLSRSASLLRASSSLRSGSTCLTTFCGSKSSMCVEVAARRPACVPSSWQRVVDLVRPGAA